MPVCDRVVSKPGYSTFSEACCTETPLITITRDDFAEAPVLVREIQHYLPHQILSPDEFFASEWEFLRQPMQPAIGDRPLDKTGNQTIAQAVVEFFARS